MFLWLLTTGKHKAFVLLQKMAAKHLFVGDITMDAIAKEQNKKPKIEPFPLSFFRQKCYNEF